MVLYDSLVRKGLCLYAWLNMGVKSTPPFSYIDVNGGGLNPYHIVVCDCTSKSTSKFHLLVDSESRVCTTKCAHLS